MSIDLAANPIDTKLSIGEFPFKPRFLGFCCFNCSVFMEFIVRDYVKELVCRHGMVALLAALEGGEFGALQIRATGKEQRLGVANTRPTHVSNTLRSCIENHKQFVA